jgi:hypothetical protein
MHDKISSYNKATDKLVSQAAALEAAVGGGKIPFAKMVQSLRESFKYKLTYKRVFGYVIKDDRAPLGTDYCKVATVYIFQNTGGDAVWQLKESPIHWWLVHKKTGAVFDITHDQFDFDFPYHLKPAMEPVFDKDEKLTAQLIDMAAKLGRAAGMAP